MACPDCKDSIFNDTKSVMANPKCNEDCPDDYGCTDTILSDCVVYTGPDLSCGGVDSGDNLTEVLKKLEITCGAANNTNNCKVKVSANDTCCDYLGNKIVSNSLLITTPTNSACVQTHIEEKCWVWNTVLENVNGPSVDGMFKLKWRNYDVDWQNAQYSGIKECVVKLRGTVINGSYNSGDTVVFILPFGYRPALIRRFSVNPVNPGHPPHSGLIEVYPDGKVIVFAYPTSSGGVIVSLDGISFECACEPNC